MNRLRGVVAGAVFVIAAFLALDFLFKQAFNLTYVLARRKFTWMRIESPIYHHDLLPRVNAASTMWGTRIYRISTNSLGFVDASPREIALKSAKSRLLVMGDSFAEGIGIPYEKTFAAELERTYRPRMEVLNAAVASYCPLIYWRKLKYLIEEKGLRIDRVVVFLDLSDIFDESIYHLDDKGNVVAEEDPRGTDSLDRTRTPLDRFLNREFLILPHLAEAMFYKNVSSLTHPLRNFKSLWTSDPKIYDQYGEKGLKNAQLHMDWLDALLRSHHIQWALAIYPWPDQVARQEIDSRQVKVWSSWAAAHQVPFLNLFPTFISAGLTPTDSIQKYYISGDVHWNETGHRVVGERTVSFLNGAFSE